MLYRNATVADIPQIESLQKRYHVSFISEEEKKNGFVTTLFTPEQLTELIEQEDGISLACDVDKVVAYAMAGSWQFWSKWPLFQFMIADLPSTQYLGRTLTIENSYQYGPVCIDMAYRGQGVLQELFAHSARQMGKRYPILITFINHVNPRSYKAHTEKVGLEVIKNFSFNGNNYYELGYDTSRALQDKTTRNPS
jgi:hypothetical protein